MKNRVALASGGKFRSSVLPPREPLELCSQGPEIQILGIPVFEIPFWLVIFYWSFWPATWTPSMTYREWPLDSKDVVLAIVAVWYFAQWLLAGRKRSKAPDGTYHYLPTIALALIGYAALSMSWSEVGQEHHLGIVWTLVLTASSWALAYCLIARIPNASLEAFLFRVTLFLAIVSVVYGLESLIGLGVRSEPRISTFGIPRLHGPLFGASVGHFVLLPAFGLAAAGVVAAESRRDLSRRWFASITLLIAVFLLGSRGALVCFACFALLTALLQRGVVKVQATVLVISLSLISAALLIGAEAKLDRLQNFEDVGRAMTHRTAWTIFRCSSWNQRLRGAGYGAFWPWYTRDGWHGNDTPDYYMQHLVESAYGPTLYHPHSVFLLVGIELGLAGILVLIRFWHVLGKLIFRYGNDPRLGMLCCGLFASALAIFFDTFFFKGQRLSCVWCIYFLGALRLVAARDQANHENHEARAGGTRVAPSRRPLGRPPVLDRHEGIRCPKTAIPTRTSLLTAGSTIQANKETHRCDYR